MPQDGLQFTTHRKEQCHEFTPDHPVPRRPFPLERIAAGQHDAIAECLQLPAEGRPVRLRPELVVARGAMHEGHVFLDEKCLLLAGEILRELERYGRLQRRFLAL